MLSHQDEMLDVDILLAHELTGRDMQPREAGGSVHLNPITNKVSGAEFARQCLAAAEEE